MALRRDLSVGFWIYAAAGFVTAVGFVTAIPIVLIGFGLFAVAYRRYEWPDDLGLLVGLGLAAIVVGLALVGGRS